MRLDWKATSRVKMLKCALHGLNEELEQYDRNLVG